MTRARIAPVGTAIALLAIAASAPNRIQSLSQIDAASRTSWTASLPLASGASFTLLAERIAVLENDNRRLHFYSKDGRLLESTILSRSLSSVAAFPAGNLLLGTFDVDEDRHYQAVLTDGGAELWAVTLGSGLSFSPSGKFLLTDWDAADSSQPATIYEAETGRIVWTDPDNPAYWQLAAAENDTAAYYRRDRLSLIDLNDERLLWTQPIAADPRRDLGKLRISLDGTAIVLQFRAETERADQMVTQFYEIGGTLLWEKRVLEITDETNGGIVTGISPDGTLIAVEDLSQFSILRGSDGGELTRLEETDMCCIAAFTAEMIAFDRGSETRILRLSEGRVTDDALLTESLRFHYYPGSRPGTGSYLPLRVQRTGSETVLSEIDFDPSRNQIER